MSEPDAPDDATISALRREMDVVTSAIVLVGSGGATRATIVGLELGDALLEPMRRLARERRVRIVPVWRTDESGLDLTVERIPT